LIVARRGQAEVDTLHDEGLISRRAHAEKKALLQREALDAERTLREAEIEGGDGQVEAAILEAQRGALMDASRRGVLEADVVEEQTAEIDRSLLELREHEGEEK
jgi:monovalent cation:H+ antiporter, CPA1 family